MFCKNCGTQIAEGGKFCPKCGTPVGGVGSENVNQQSVPSTHILRNLLDNKNIIQTEKMGCFTVFEHQEDLSVVPTEAPLAYFMRQMNCKKRQVLCTLNGNSVKTQAGAMQWIAGNIESETGIKGVGGFLKGIINSAVTGESAVKPLYRGNGLLMLEPTYQYLLIEDIGAWGSSGCVMQDGLFLACDGTLQESVIMRDNLSSAIAGGEGLFNLVLSGNGYAVFESPVPRTELYEIELQDDVFKIDGNMAIAWSGSLQFTVERSSKTITGSIINSEGLVNVYRGTGKILFCPTITGTEMKTNNSVQQTTGTKCIGDAILEALS